MTFLEDIKSGSVLRGVVPSEPVEIIAVRWIGNQAVNLVYRVESGSVAQSTLYRDDQVRLQLETRGRAWTFDADGDLLRLVTEANRIKLAHHFDPYLAIHTSLVDPLPHQISALYGEMLPRQPLRFLLADDPGAGKTIMAGLLIKELIARGDLERCLVVAPGSLVEQWQDELGEKFGLEVDILTRDLIETSRSGNPFNDRKIFTSGNDIEHIFARQAHLRAAFPEIPGEELVEIIDSQIAVLRDDLIQATRLARRKIEEEVYQSVRLRDKPEWQQAAMAVDAPNIRTFLPANGIEPVRFEMSHGKRLIRAARLTDPCVVVGGTVA